jgi:hypothetical protein
MLWDDLNSPSLLVSLCVFGASFSKSRLFFSSHSVLKSTRTEMKQSRDGRSFVGRRKSIEFVMTVFMAVMVAAIVIELAGGSGSSDILGDRVAC